MLDSDQTGTPHRPSIRSGLLTHRHDL